MATLLKKGTKVRQKVKAIEGVIKRTEIVDGDQLHYLVGYTDELGNEQERAFHEDQLEVFSE